MAKPLMFPIYLELDYDGAPTIAVEVETREKTLFLYWSRELLAKSAKPERRAEFRTAADLLPVVEEAQALGVRAVLYGLVEGQGELAPDGNPASHVTEHFDVTEFLVRLRSRKRQDEQSPLN